MLTVAAETFLRSSPDETWAVLGRRSTYLRLPGVTRGSEAAGRLQHALDLPILDNITQTVALSIARVRGNDRRERRFSLRGAMASITGCWTLEPADGGVRLRVTLAYDIAPSLKEQAVTTLRSRSPLPIRTDADAILSRAVDEFFETRLAEHAAAYCDTVRAQMATRSA
jgi:hypothetical protein